MMNRNSAECGARSTGLWTVGLAAALLLAGCASDPPADGPRGHPPPGGPDGGPGRDRAALFISPSGEPFRSLPGQPYPVAVWFKGADANGDGKLSRDEFVADAARFFAVLDANHDGVIDGFEIRDYETGIAPEIVADSQSPAQQSGQGAAPGAPPQGGQGGGRGGGGRRGGRGGGQGGQSSGAARAAPGAGGINAQGAAPYGLLPDREPVASSDLDLTGKITLKNFQTRAGQRFDRLDVMGQGYLALAQLPKTPLQKILEQRQKQRQDGQRPAPPPQ